MEVVKKTNRYTIFKKRSGRYGVRSAGGAWVNGDDKAKILMDEGLIKKVELAPKKSEEQEEDSSVSDAGAEESGQEVESSDAPEATT